MTVDLPLGAHASTSCASSFGETDVPLWIPRGFVLRVPLRRDLFLKNTSFHWGKSLLFHPSNEFTLLVQAEITIWTLSSNLYPTKVVWLQHQPRESWAVSTASVQLPFHDLDVEFWSSWKELNSSFNRMIVVVRLVFFDSRQNCTFFSPQSEWTCLRNKVAILCF